MGTERTDELYKVLLTKGYPKELCAEIAYKNLNTDYTATDVYKRQIHCYYVNEDYPQLLSGFIRLNPSGTLVTLDTVSYTHLDVYKRQLTDSRWSRCDFLSGSNGSDRGRISGKLFYSAFFHS